MSKNQAEVEELLLFSDR